MNEYTTGWKRWVWLAIAGAIVAVSLTYWWGCWFNPTTTVFLVRHADRAPGNVDDLHNPLGTDRANELIHVVGQADIKSVYHSDTLRGQKTAQPLADHLGLTPITYPALDVGDLASEIRAGQAGYRVFVVGHSNTVPAIVEKLGGDSSGDIPHDVYDDLFVITLCRCTTRAPSVVNMKYGATTPAQ